MHLLKVLSVVLKVNVNENVSTPVDKLKNIFVLGHANLSFYFG